MADEAEILTENEAGDSWVDLVPGEVDTGYQNQNTNITGRTLGKDLTTVVVDKANTNVILKSNSGAVDSLGVPFVIKTDVVFDFTALATGVNYFVMDDGTTSLLKTITLSAVPPVWNESRAYYETSTGQKRVLNWVVVKDDDNVTARRLRAFGPMDEDQDSSGVGKAGKIWFHTPGNYAVTIAETGVYSLLCIAGGENTYDTGSGAGANGGGSARVELRLSAGNRVLINVGAAGQDTALTISGRLSVLTESDGQGPSTINVLSGVTISQNTYIGGPAVSNDIGEGFELVTPGGGAGRFANGVSGRCMVENFGLGGDGDATGGFVSVEWFGD